MFTDPLRVCSGIYIYKHIYISLYICNINIVEILNPSQLKGRIAIMERGDCIFVDKARKVEAAGAIAAIIIDNVPSTSSTFSPMFIMSGDGNDDVNIPVVFLFAADAKVLKSALDKNPLLEVVLQSSKNQTNNIQEDTKPDTINLKYFTANFVKVDDKVVVVIEYSGTPKTLDFKQELNKDENMFAPFLWERKRKEILQRIYTDKLELPEDVIAYYFKIVNELRDPTFKSTHMGLKWMVHWLLNELELEHDPKSIYAIPSQLIVEAGKSDVKNKLAATQQLFDEILRFKDKSLIEILERMDKIQNIVKSVAVDNDVDRTLNNKRKDEL